MIECVTLKELDESICAWVAARIPDCTKLAGRAIGVLRNAEPVAGCIYHSFTGHNVVCDIAVAPGFSLPRGVLRTLFSYPFITLSCLRITVYVGHFNEASTQFVERLGFTREGTMREASPRGDYHLYGMLKRECKWIR